MRGMDEINSGMELAPSPLLEAQRQGELTDSGNVTTLLRLGASAFAVDVVDGMQKWRAVSRVKPAPVGA